MRWLAVLIFLAVAITANAADRAGIPHIRPGVSYEAARNQLIGAGFRPVPFRVRAMEMCSGDSVCQRAPELIDSSNGQLAYRWFLFVRRRDGRFLTVQALYESLRFAGAEWTDAAGYQWLIAKEYGGLPGSYQAVDPHDMVLLRAAAKRYSPPEKPQAEPVLPLCRDAPPHTACWVKPPADWKPPPKP